MKNMTTNQTGFSLLEIMVVLALIAVAGTYVVSNIFQQFQEANVTAVKTQIRAFKSNLETYRRYCFRYPTSEEGLDALIEKPESCKNYPTGGILKENSIPDDPWGNPYEYSSEASNKFEIKSYGADGQPGGEGFDADVSSNDKGV